MSRYYRRGPGGRPAYTYIGGNGPSRAVRALIIANVAVFVLQYLDPFGVFSLFVLQPAAVTERFFIWQIVTYLFLHGGLFHILINMFVLWMFGTQLEAIWGPREFVRFYLICGAGAGILTVLVDPYSPIPVVGASGAVYGLLLAYGILFPKQIIYLYMLIPMEARYFVMLVGGIAFLAALGGPGDGIAHVAHLGGMVFGYIYLRGFQTRRRSRGPTLADRYQQWRRARLRRKFEVYYNERQAKRQKDPDDPNKWTN